MPQLPHQVSDGCHELTNEHLEELKEVMALGFQQDNELWGSFSPKKEDLLKFFEKVIRSHIESQQRIKKKYDDRIASNFVYIENGRIVDSNLYYELEDYIQMQKKGGTGQLELFKYIESKGKQLIKNINFSAYPARRCVYLDFASKNVLISQSKLTKFMHFIEYVMRLKQSGFTTIVGRASSPKSLEYTKKIGSRVVNEVVFEREGKKYPLYFFEIDLNNETLTFFIQNFNSLKEMREREKKQAGELKPKL